MGKEALLQQFLASLRAKWAIIHGPQRCAQMNIAAGIAVSGGVDSMALAILCARLQRIYRRLRVVAIIVDHKARPGSGAEAFRTRQRLRSIGLRSIILPLSWSVERPLDLPNFESQARTLRYRAIGRACRDLNLQCLMTAHHRDDQAETILMRAASGHSGSGLLGIPPVGDIPECWGLHGVHRSSRSIYPSRRQRKLLCNVEDRAALVNTERGGIKIIRPLLDQDKATMIELCRSTNIEWEEDSTNAETWRTLRNSVRHILRHHNLPKALQPPALVTLSRACRAHVTQLEQALVPIECAYEDIHLDLRSAHLTLSIPDELMVRFDHNTTIHHQHSLAATKRLAQIVSPMSSIPSATLHNAAASLFPLSDGSSNVQSKDHFTAAGVQFRRLPQIRAKGSQRWTTQWSLSRQPISTLEPLQLTALSQSRWTPWVLYDGRYWLRVFIPSTCHFSDIRVRPLHKTDAFLARSDQGGYKRLREILAQCASGKIRWTLPAIVSAEERPRVLALPSLGMSAVGSCDAEILRWEIRYKQIDVVGSTAWSVTSW